MNRLLDTNTRYFDQDSFEIPKLTNTWGAMINTLDCTLVTGTSKQPVLLVTQEEEDLYWIFILTVNEGHGFKENLSVVNVQESSLGLLNGLHRVQKVNKNQVILAILKNDSTLPEPILDTTGMTIKLEPLGYEKVLEDTQKGVYKTSNVLAKKAYLRVDNSCPEGYDPSWAKFSRISVFSDIRDMEDYQFRLGRLKIPCWIDNYTKSENDRVSVWFNSRSRSYAHIFNIEQISSLADVANFYIIGDDKTFYIYIKEINFTSSANYSDCIYTFGEYEKYMYKEDPLPFILYTSSKYDNTNYMYYSPSTQFSRDFTTGKYIFNADFNYNFTTQYHQNWSFWLDENFLSASNTKINFKPFKNEMTYNLFPKIIKCHRENNVVMEGCLRGIYDFMCNLNDTPEATPSHLEIIKSDTLYLTTTARDYQSQSLKHAFKLSNWS